MKAGRLLDRPLITAATDHIRMAFAENLGVLERMYLDAMGEFAPTEFEAGPDLLTERSGS